MSNSNLKAGANKLLMVLSIIEILFGISKISMINPSLAIGIPLLALSLLSLITWKNAEFAASQSILAMICFVFVIVDTVSAKMYVTLKRQIGNSSLG